MFCLTCDADKHPVTTFTAKGMVDACPTCQGVFVRHDEPESARDQWPGSPEDIAAKIADGYTLVAPGAQPATAPARPVAKPSAPSDALSIIDQMRARLAVVEDAIATRDGYLAEREMLRKMLAAADGETRPAASVFTN